VIEFIEDQVHVRRSQLLIQIFGLKKMPLVVKGDDIGGLIVKAAAEEGLQIQGGDVIVIAQKIVSKAEGKTVALNSVTPSILAEDISKATGKDPRHVETILRETASVVRMREAHLIVETRHGFVCANAGVDKSNVEDQDSVTLLPTDPDKSAHEIRERILSLTGADTAVIISDTFGRAWRIGQANVAIGLDGMKALEDYRGSQDMFGYVLNVTQIAIADELASAGELAMRKSDRVPVVVIRGFNYAKGNGNARELIRPKEEDLFR
jgi:coenzyme F420-0:L-glutamate ligase/coenzyme F420-1:gamma-L-glutamate ligase